MGSFVLRGRESQPPAKMNALTVVMMSLTVLLSTLAGGFLLGFVFTALRLPLPVPPLAGLIAAAACLGGSATFELVRQHWFS